MEAELYIKMKVGPTDPIPQNVLVSLITYDRRVVVAEMRKKLSFFLVGPILQYNSKPMRVRNVAKGEVHFLGTLCLGQPKP